MKLLESINYNLAVFTYKAKPFLSDSFFLGHDTILSRVIGIYPGIIILFCHKIKSPLWANWWTYHWHSFIHSLTNQCILFIGHLVLCLKIRNMNDICYLFSKGIEERLYKPMMIKKTGEKSASSGDSDSSWQEENPFNRGSDGVKDMEAWSTLSCHGWNKELRVWRALKEMRPETRENKGNGGLAKVGLDSGSVGSGLRRDFRMVVSLGVLKR